MQIMIDIPKEQYNTIKSDLYNTFPSEMKKCGLEAIRNGVPLPEGHGRLIDADELKTAFPTCDNSLDIKVASVRAAINHTPTIIEADKAESEE